MRIQRGSATQVFFSDDVVNSLTPGFSQVIAAQEEVGNRSKRFQN
jgi:hypothetical protein